MKIKKISVILIVALLVCTLFVSMTACNDDNKDSLQRVLDNGEFTVVGSGGYRPFNYYDENGKVVGFDVDVGEEIASRLGVKLNYVTSDWDGLIEGLKSKRYDGIIGSMAIKEERKVSVNFSIPYYYSGAQLVVNKDSGYTTTKDMEGKQIAVATGTTYVQDAEKLGATASLYLDDNATILDLVNKRVDGVITDLSVALTAMNEISGGENLELCGDVLRTEEIAIAINKEDDTLLAKINEILEDMHEDGTLTKISQKWLNEDISVA